MAAHASCCSGWFRRTPARRTLAAHGGVDILVNNVGGAEPKRLPETTDDDWQRAFEHNLFQAVRLSRLVLPEMKKRGGGSILNIASIAGRESGSAMTYNAAKAAMISMIIKIKYFIFCALWCLLSSILLAAVFVRRPR